MASTGSSSTWDKAPIDSESSSPSSSPPRMSSFQDESSAKMLLEGRMVRLVIYGALTEDTHQIWLDSRARFRDVANELVTINSSGEFVILQPHWGPKPHWRIADANSGIESTCQVIYAIFMRKPVRYIVGLARTQELDYPIVIFEATERQSMTISQAVITSNPTLDKLAKSISRYPDGQDVSDHLIDYDELESSNPLTFPTVLIIMVDKPLGDLLSDLPSNPVPIFLQISLAYCQHLLKRAYNLNHFSFQMIHVSRAIRHLLICLVQRIGDAHEKEDHGLEAAGGDLAELLRLALLYSRALQALLERVNGIIDRLESPPFIRSEIQNAVGGVFNDICGDYPGSIAIRYSHVRLEELAKMDREEELEAHGGSEVAGAETTSLDIVIQPVSSPLGIPTMHGDIDMDGVAADADRAGSKDQSDESDIYLENQEHFNSSGAHSRTLTPISEAQGPSAYPPASPYLSPRPSPRALPLGGGDSVLSNYYRLSSHAATNDSSRGDLVRAPLEEEIGSVPLLQWEHGTERPPKPQGKLLVHVEVVHNPETQMRILRLSKREQAIVLTDGGNTVESQLHVLDTIERYPPDHNNQRVWTEARILLPSGKDTIEYRCKAPGCAYHDTKSQKARQHFVSHHVAEACWACPIEGCLHVGNYKRLDDLKHHHMVPCHGVEYTRNRKRETSERPTNTSTAGQAAPHPSNLTSPLPEGQVPTVATISTLDQFGDQWPVSLPTSTQAERSPRKAREARLKVSAGPSQVGRNRLGRTVVASGTTSGHGRDILVGTEASSSTMFYQDTTPLGVAPPAKVYSHTPSPQRHFQQRSPWSNHSAYVSTSLAENAYSPDALGLTHVQPPPISSSPLLNSASAYAPQWPAQARGFDGFKPPSPDLAGPRTQDTPTPH